MCSAPEFLNNWNAVFKFKIKESDLHQPNEVFLTNALLHYLEKFNFDLSLLMNAKDCEISDNRRKFKIDLCAYIDYLYKSGNEANSFLYYDLICPSQKKTNHLLKYLFNYLLFFCDVMKEEIIVPTEKKIQERSKLLDKQSKLRIEYEKNQCLQKSIGKTLEKYRIQLPKLNRKFNNLEIKEREQYDKKKRLEISLENHKIKLREIKKDERNKLCNIVSEEEIENLFSKKENIQKLITEQREVEQSIKISDRERLNSIVQLEPLIKKLDKTISIMNLEDIHKFKQLKQTHHELCEKIKKQKLNNDNTIELIKKDMKMVEKLDVDLYSKIDNLKKLVETCNDEISKTEKNYAIEEHKNTNLQLELNKLNADLMEQNDISNTIVNSTEKMLNHLISRDPTMLKNDVK